MRSETVKHIVKYYGGIPEAIKLLKRERDALEDEYNGLGGLAMDGMPHSSAPGNPTEALAVRVIENGVKNRLQEIQRFRWKSWRATLPTSGAHWTQ